MWLEDSESDSYNKNDMKRKRMYHVQNKSKFLRLYLIKGLESTVQNILMSLNILYELHMRLKKYVEY